MKTKSKYMLLLTLLLSAVGLGLMTWLLHTGVDNKGLFIISHPAITLLFVLTGLQLLLMFLHMLVLPKENRPSHEPPMSTVQAMGLLVAASGLLYTSISFMLAEHDTLELILAVLGFVCVLCLGFVAICKLSGTKYSCFPYVSVTVYFMVFLAYQYRLWSSETQLLVYFFPLLATVFLMVSTYYRAAQTARDKRPRQLEFFALGGLFFSCLAIPGTYWVLFFAMAVWMATDPCLLHTQAGLYQRGSETAIPLPHAAAACVWTLKEAGFDAYLVGGCVRDSLLGLSPHDYDLCTNATPEEIQEIFKDHKLVLNGTKHGTVGVVFHNAVYEITTFRTEGAYQDSRHPDWVKFVSNIEDDLARRDFTVNAIAYCPERGYVDPFGGKKDLQGKILRAVGVPENRFTEDPLRILRGVRFAVRYGLTPEAKTEEAMNALAPEIGKLAKERVFEELSRLLPLMTAEDILRYKTILINAIEELEPAVGFAQHTPHHKYDVFTHTAYVMEGVPDVLHLRWAALLHDVGKPAAFTMDENGQGHFKGHAALSAQTADAVLRRLKAPNDLREQVVCLVKHHMDPLEPDKPLLRRRLGKLGVDTIRNLLILQKADFAAKGVESDGQELEEFAKTEAVLEEILQEKDCLTTRDLQVTGNDLLALGFVSGPKLGQCMEKLLELVQDETVPNEKEALLAKAQEFLEA